MEFTTHYTKPLTVNILETVAAETCSYNALCVVYMNEKYDTPLKQFLFNFSVCSIIILLD